jgi:ATP-binding cassette subfamily B protein
MQGMRRYFQAQADYESLVQYEREVRTVEDKRGAKPLTVQRGTVTFDNVSFKYGATPVLKEFSLQVKPNEKIALVGVSGSGKSTIVKLLYRFYDVNEGAVRVDGIDVRDVQQESLRGELAIVPQDTILFDDTLENNLRFANPKATHAQLLAAVKNAQLSAFVKALPKGLRTVVGERGIKLSGGERQRVAVARALLANKRVLILDEATSSLDSSTEHAIQQALSALLQGRTSIIIAHRLSTIMRADRIIVLERGRVVQEGTHASLVKKPGRYRSLWKLQKGGYIGG